MRIENIEKKLLAACLGAMDEVEYKVHNEFSKNLDNFYGSYTPAEYIRTGALRGSLNTTGVKSTGNGAEAEVYFTTPSYQTGWVPLQSGDYGWAEWSGQKVLDNAMDGSHGGWAHSAPIWSTSMNNLGDLKALLLAEAKFRL